MLGMPRRFLWGLLSFIVCWSAIRLLGWFAGGWPWPDDRPRTALVTALMAILVAALFVSLANLLAGIGRWPDRREPTRP